MRQILSALLFLATLDCARALPNFDPFADATAAGGTSYAVGSGLAPNQDAAGANATNNWQLLGSNNPGTPQPTIVAGNLSYPGLPASTGNSVSIAPSLGLAGQSARVGLNLSATPSVVYFSFLLQITDVSALSPTPVNGFFAGFSDTVGAQGAALSRCAGRLMAKQVNDGYVLGIAINNQTGEYQYDPTVRSTNDVLFVVGSYERAGGSTNVNLWVNPATNSFGEISPPAPTIGQTNGVVNTSTLNVNGARAFLIGCQFANAPGGIIDEVRIATNWGFVTGGNPTFPVSIAAHPSPRTVKAGDKVAFVVGASGTSPAYQWRLNGTNIDGATAAAYAIANADGTNAGSYSVVVTNVMNALTSNPAVLTVSQTPFQLYQTNLVVVRVGDGAQALATSGNSVFLDQFTTAGTYLNTVFIPDTGPSALIEPGPDLNGSTLTGTQLTRSADKRLLALSGYNVALGNATPLQNTFSTNVPRGVVTIDAASLIVLAVADTNAYSGAYFRGAVTDGTNNFWGSGSAEGTYYLGLNSTSALVQTFFSNNRSVDIFNGNLYCLASSSASGLLKFTGLPTTDQGLVPNILAGFSSTTTTDFSVDPTDTLIYLTVGGTVQKWEFDGSILAFTNAYTLNVPGGASRYLTVDYSGVSPVIYVDNGGGQLFRIEDTGTNSTATTLATVGPNQVFKGVRFGPSAGAVVAPPVLSFDRAGSDLILNWSGAFLLQSATNVAGPYADVSGAFSPYTNSTVSPARQFFRLRN